MLFVLRVIQNRRTTLSLPAFGRRVSRLCSAATSVEPKGNHIYEVQESFGKHILVFCPSKSIMRSVAKLASEGIFIHTEQQRTNLRRLTRILRTRQQRQLGLGTEQ